MAEAEFDIDRAHRWFGVECNNGIFPLLEKADRSEEETERMIAMAFASTLHWEKYSKGTIVNTIRGTNMIATTMCYAERKECALHYAERNLALVEANKSAVADFDIAYAYMVMARSHALSGNRNKALHFLEECVKATSAIADDEDRKITEGDLHSGPWFGVK